MSRPGARRRLLVGLAFLLPNIAGFCAFTLVPLAISFGMAFTDWDFLRRNVFRHDPLHWVGFGNFSRLLADPQLWRDLGNTFFLMLGLPFAIAGSLGSALLLNRVGGRRSRPGPALAAATLVFVASGLVLLRGGLAEQGVWFLFGILAGTVLLAGVFTRGSVYQTLFYLPHFTAGVATYVLWKKLYHPTSGPINLAVTPVLDAFASVVRAAPGVFSRGLPVASSVAALLLVAWQLGRLRRRWDDSEAGAAAVVAGALVPAVPLGLLLGHLGVPAAAAAAIATAACALILAAILRRPRPWGPACATDAGLGSEIALALALVPAFVLLAACIVLGPALPARAAVGLEAPDWLGSYAWAKPALMIMALWAAIGSNTMILYLAGLSSIPPELYEAADMDGASAGQRFWNITWPQLAPVTFFVGVMGVIEGLQGGFEMARTMTSGGPAGSTTTLSYFIYTEGFETGRLGYASAVAWVLFALVFILSLLNFRYGNRNAND
jgi:multiple sugar transport system permease protein